MSTPDLARLARQFESFALREALQSSPFYSRLSLQISRDPEMLALAAHSGTGQPVSNLLFGAVHYLLLKDPAEPLAAFYPGLAEADGKKGPTGDDPYPAFRAFCLDHAGEIIPMLRSRLVQTNEVRRCALLLPAFCVVAEWAGRPLALIEIGPSAGLNLLWRSYHYVYTSPGGEVVARMGDSTSRVVLRCELRGTGRPAFPAAFPAVQSSVGIDLHPIDVSDDEAIAWLRALIWPEHADRVELLEQAVTIARLHPPSLLSGDALELLPAVLAGVPADAVPVVFHSFTLNQFSREARDRFSGLVAQAGATCDLAHVSIEHTTRGSPDADLALELFDGGVRRAPALAVCHPHGRWMEWENETW